MRPFARLRSAKGRVYSKAAEFLVHLAEDEQNQRETEKDEQSQRRQRRKARVEVRSLKEFHDDASYGGDLHRADMAWAKHAAGYGVTLEQIKNELFNGRDLSKKGNRKRQIEYVTRTTLRSV
jgi:uncharacterized protein YfiM (DUF2279 family)